MGMLHNYGDNFANVIPEWLKEKVKAFLLSCQAENGYFYLPQWGREVSIARTSRDLSSATYLLERLGAEPKYPLPTVKCDTDRANADKKYDINNAPERFRSKENFLLYLESHDLEKSSYSVGSELLAQMAEIIAYSKLIGEDLALVTIEYFNKHKRRDNGIWQQTVDYHGVNGLHKISWVYNLAGVPIPDIRACADSALEVILSDIPASHVVSVYNPWHAIGELVKNIKNSGSKDEYESFVTYVREKAPAAIRKIIKKIEKFKMPTARSVMHSVAATLRHRASSPPLEIREVRALTELAVARIHLFRVCILHSICRISLRRFTTRMTSRCSWKPWKT